MIQKELFNKLINHATRRRILQEVAKHTNTIVDAMHQFVVHLSIHASSSNSHPNPSVYISWLQTSSHPVDTTIHFDIMTHLAFNCHHTDCTSDLSPIIWLYINKLTIGNNSIHVHVASATVRYLVSGKTLSNEQRSTAKGARSSQLGSLQENDTLWDTIKAQRETTSWRTFSFVDIDSRHITLNPCGPVIVYQQYGLKYNNCNSTMSRLRYVCPQWSSVAIHHRSQLLGLDGSLQCFRLKGRNLHVSLPYGVIKKRKTINSPGSGTEKLLKQQLWKLSVIESWIVLGQSNFAECFTLPESDESTCFGPNWCA